MVKVTLKEAKPDINIELTYSEAQTLRALVGAVAGSRTNSRAKHTFSLYDQLNALGIKSTTDIDTTISYIFFKDTNPEEL